jgi:hypothetical protein
MEADKEGGGFAEPASESAAIDTAFASVHGGALCLSNIVKWGLFFFEARGRIGVGCNLQLMMGQESANGWTSPEARRSRCHNIYQLSCNPFSGGCQLWPIEVGS